MIPIVSATATLLGCGDLGGRIGVALAERGIDVTAVRRHADAVPDPLRAVSLDLTDEGAELPDLTADLLLVCLTADDRDEGGYRRTYVDGMRRGLAAATRSGAPQRAVLVSSTGVYGDVEGWIDEATEPRPERGTSRVLLEAERAFGEVLPHGTVARLSGLYGRAAPRVVEQVRRGDRPHPGRWTNRIHRDDAAAAVVHLLTRDEAPGPLYVVSDDEPCTAGQLQDFVAEQLGIGGDATEEGVTPFGKRLDNALLRATGLELTYPSYRDGYPPLLRESTPTSRPTSRTASRTG